MRKSAILSPKPFVLPSKTISTSAIPASSFSRPSAFVPPASSSLTVSNKTTALTTTSAKDIPPNAPASTAVNPLSHSRFINPMRNNSIDMNKKQKVEIDDDSKSDTDLNSSSLMIHGMDSNNNNLGAGVHEPECYIVLFTKNRNKKKKSFDDGVVVSKQNKLILHDMEGAVVHQINFKYEKLPSGRVIISGQLEIEIQNEIPFRDFQSGKVFIGMTSTCTTTAATTNNAGTQNSNVQNQRPNSLINKQFVAVVSSNIQSKVSNTMVSKAAMSLHSADTPGACVLKLANPAKGTVDIVIDPTIASYLRPHQRDGVKFMFDCLTSEKFGGHGCILADEMGLGKTIQSIALIWTLMKQGPQGHAKPYCFKAIVVCPSSLVDNWGNEVRKWLGQERLMPITVNVTGEAAKKAVEEFKVTRVRRLLIISYETLRKYIPLIQQIPGIELLICDEGHRLKSAAGNKTISALQSIKTKRRVLLTGTPVQNQLDEFYAMVSFVNPDAIGKDPRNFKAIFQTPIEQGRDKNATAEQIEIAEARSKQLQELTSYFVLRRTAEINHKFLPPKKEITLFCKMSPTQLKAYKDFIESTAVKSLLSAKSNRNSSGGGGIDALRLIMQLKQLCTHPNLVRETEGDDAGSDADADEEDDEGSHLNDDYEIDSFLSEDSEMERKPKKQEKVKKSMAHQGKSIAEVLEKQRKEMVFKQQSVNATELSPQVSGKIAVIDQMLQKIYEEDENNRVVLVSNSTKTFDFLENLCNFRKMVALRLDRSTPQPVRQSLVNRFNDLSSNIEREKRPFAFLLSAKAGGCGLNLIGANRLILVDPDWNPAVDQQAAARIWRDGQKKTVFIYRCLSTGTIEERIFQRQIMKLYTASGIVSSSSSSDTKIEKKQSDFSRADLKELFTFQQHTHCDTYDLMKKKFEEGELFSSIATSSKNKKRKRIIVEESEDEEEFGDESKMEMINEKEEEVNNKKSRHINDKKDDESDDDNSEEDEDENNKEDIKAIKQCWPEYKGMESVEKFGDEALMEVVKDLKDIITWVHCEQGSSS